MSDNYLDLKNFASLSEPRWKKRIINVGYLAINESIRKSVALEGSVRGVAAPAQYARGIAVALNRGLRSEKLRYVDDNEE